MESKIKSMIVAEKKENGNGCATKSFESIHTNWHRIGRKCYDEDLEVRHWGFWFLLSFESPPISLLTDCLLAPDCQDFSSDLFYTELTSALSTQGDQPTQVWESGSCPKDCWLAILAQFGGILKFSVGTASTTLIVSHCVCCIKISKIDRIYKSWDL